MDHPEILGQRRSLYCYHRLAPFHSKLYRRQLAIQPSPDQGRPVLLDTGLTAPAT